MESQVRGWAARFIQHKRGTKRTFWWDNVRRAVTVPGLFAGVSCVMVETTGNEEHLASARGSNHTPSPLLWRVCAVYCRSTTVFLIWFCTYISSMHRLTPLTRCLHIMIVARFNKPLVILIKKDNESNKKIKILWIQGKRKRLYPETKTDILDALTI